MPTAKAYKVLFSLVFPFFFCLMPNGLKFKLTEQHKKMGMLMLVNVWFVIDLNSECHRPTNRQNVS